MIVHHTAKRWQHKNKNKNEKVFLSILNEFLYCSCYFKCFSFLVVFSFHRTVLVFRLIATLLNTKLSPHRRLRWIRFLLLFSLLGAAHFKFESILVAPIQIEASISAERTESSGTNERTQRCDGRSATISASPIFYFNFWNSIQKKRNWKKEKTKKKIYHGPPRGNANGP